VASSKYEVVDDPVTTWSTQVISHFQTVVNLPGFLLMYHQSKHGSAAVKSVALDKVGIGIGVSISKKTNVG